MKKMIKLMAIAKTQYEQEQGLQHVKKLDDLNGMLFIFENSRIASFWGKNTYIPLDIAFIDKDNTIIKTSKIVPHSLSSVSSDKPCKMALEVSANDLDKIEAKVGKKN